MLVVLLAAGDGAAADGFFTTGGFRDGERKAERVTHGEPREAFGFERVGVQVHLSNVANVREVLA